MSSGFLFVVGFSFLFLVTGECDDDFLGGGLTFFFVAGFLRPTGLSKVGLSGFLKEGGPVEDGLVFDVEVSTVFFRRNFSLMEGRELVLE